MEVLAGLFIVWMNARYLRYNLSISKYRKWVGENITVTQALHRIIGGFESTRIAKTHGSTSISYQSDAKVSDWCWIEVPRFFAIYEGYNGSGSLKRLSWSRHPRYPQHRKLITFFFRYVHGYVVPQLRVVPVLNAKPEVCYILNQVVGPRWELLKTSLMISQHWF